MKLIKIIIEINELITLRDYSTYNYEQPLHSTNL